MTEKEIYDFVSKKLEEAKAQVTIIGDGYKYSNSLDTECCMLEAKIRAYQEVLDFIGTVRADETHLSKKESMDLRLKLFQNAQARCQALQNAQAAVEDYDKE